MGKKVKYDVTSATGLVLIPAGTALDKDNLRLLQLHRIRPEELNFTSDRTDSDPSALPVKQANQYAKHLFYRVKTKRKIPLLEIKTELIPLVQEASMNDNVFQLFEAVKAKDEYTHKHIVGVGVLSTLIGTWMGLDESEQSMLTLAATLHDVGKVRIADDILNKPDKLTPDEFDEMKRHTIYGYEMLRETVGLSPRIANVALQHHERMDGSGYPLRVNALQLDPLSRIVAVADVFHAMSSRRPYHEALPFYEVVKRMRQGFFGELDPNIVSVFFNNLIRNLIGKQVQLTDGRMGEVVYINPHDDISPLVKVENAFLDLSKDRSVCIMQVIV